MSFQPGDGDARFKRAKTDSVHAEAMLLGITDEFPNRQNRGSVSSERLNRGTENYSRDQGIGTRCEFAPWRTSLNGAMERKYRHLPAATSRQTGFRVLGWLSRNSADVLTTSPMMGDDPVSLAPPGPGCKSSGYDVKGIRILTKSIPCLPQPADDTRQSTSQVPGSNLDFVNLEVCRKGFTGINLGTANDDPGLFPVLRVIRVFPAQKKEDIHRKPFISQPPATLVDRISQGVFRQPPVLSISSLGLSRLFAAATPTGRSSPCPG